MKYWFLRSSSLVKEVVSDLDLYATVYNQGKVKQRNYMEKTHPFVLKR
jgi:hypothetical protein